MVQERTRGFRNPLLLLITPMAMRFMLQVKWHHLRPGLSTPHALTNACDRLWQQEGPEDPSLDGSSSDLHSLLHSSVS